MAGIAVVQAAWANTPYRAGTIHYFCDCGTGASAGCVPGDDLNNGLTTSTPRRTIAAAISALNSAPTGDTIALCKGGAFNATGTLMVVKNCTAGTYCNDLREFSPTLFSASAKPLINVVTGFAGINFGDTGYGGVRILNLSIKGDGGQNQLGVGLNNGDHDVVIGNVDFDALSIAIYLNNGTGIRIVNNVAITGNRITNSNTMAFLGAASNLDLSYNYLDGNGSNNNVNHPIYLNARTPVENMNVVGNYVHGQYGPICAGSLLDFHVAVTGFNVTDNYVALDHDKAGAGCWGIDSNEGGNLTAVYMRNTRIANNTFVNTGNTAISYSNCPDCIVENNLIIQDWFYSPGYQINGIRVSSEAARSAYGDDVNDRNVIRNNTIYFGPRVTGGADGIVVTTEGTGHKITNNTVYYTATSHPNQAVHCFNFPLALTSYSVIDNNNCHSNDTSYSWEANHGATLSAWKTYAASYGFDAHSFVGDPLFVSPGSAAGAFDFSTQSGSPLRGNGNDANKSAADILGRTRASPPDIGAYEH
jgi:hypothetical protein